MLVQEGLQFERFVARPYAGGRCGQTTRLSHEMVKVTKQALVAIRSFPKWGDECEGRHGARLLAILAAVAFIP